MEQQRYGFNKEQGTKGTAKRAAISLPFYLFHIWPGRVKAHHIFFFVCDSARRVSGYTSVLGTKQAWSFPSPHSHRY